MAAHQRCVFVALLSLGIASGGCVLRITSDDDDIAGSEESGMTLPPEDPATSGNASYGSVGDGDGDEPVEPEPADGGSDGGMIEPDPGPMATSYAEAIAPLFAASCSCHDAGQPPALDHASIVGVASTTGMLLVEPDSPADSYLFLKLTGDPLIVGSIMPLGGDQLAEDDLALVEQWIAEGAAE